MFFSVENLRYLAYIRFQMPSYKPFWYFTPAQQRGALALGIVLASLAGILYFADQSNKITTDTKSSSEKPTNPPSETQTAGFSDAQDNQKLIEINTADSAAFESLPGIGPVLAARIVKFRKVKKGFSSVDDLKSVYGLSPETFELIKSLCYVSSESATIQKVEESSIGNQSASTPTNELQSIETADLNAVDSAKLQILTGFSGRMCRSILNYRKSLGGFSSWNQVEKTYNLTPEMFALLKEKCFLNEKSAKAAEPASKPSYQNASATQNYSRKKIDINTADSAAFEALPGFGGYSAAKIVSERDAIGGFHSVEQVGEVYGIKPEFFEMAKPYLELKTQPVLKKINVNTATEQTLANHPYIRYTLAKRIVNYRNEHGSFTNFLSLQKIQGVESQTWEKLQPYLEF